MASLQWTHDVHPGEWLLGRLSEQSDGTLAWQVTAYQGTMEVYADVELSIAGHQEVYRVHGTLDPFGALVPAQVTVTGIEELTT
jgi:hypothetical protein